MRAILFDKDGTLLDFEATWGPLYRKLTLDITEDKGKARDLLVAGGLDAATGLMRSGSVLAAGTTAEIVRAWFPRLRGEAFHAMVRRIDGAFHTHGMQHSVPVQGVNETLDELAAMGFVMGVATNDAMAAAKAALASLGLDRHLDHVFGYDSVEHPKPGPDIVHAFAKTVGVEVAQVAVVGDNRHDMEMARSAGAGLAIGVLSGNSGPADLAPLADVVLPSIRELPAWLRQSMPAFADGDTRGEHGSFPAIPEDPPGTG